MQFHARLFTIKDDKVIYLEGRLYDSEENPLWNEVEDYEAQLKKHLESFIYVKVNKPSIED